LQQTRNPNGGAIAIGHPLGASGARLVTTAIYQLQTANARYALCAMCIAVDQGIATIIECLLKSPLICAGEENGQTSLLQLLMYGLFAGIAVR
jgi:Thiolase, C-terminal domain